MQKFSVVYILQSERDPKRHYTGLTDHLADRLRRHNAGECAHTSKHRPWKIRAAVADNECDSSLVFLVFDPARRYLFSSFFAGQTETTTRAGCVNHPASCRA
jgi:putative endonuclease